MSQTNADIVVDKAESKLSDLWTREDYWAIWLGFAILAVAFFLFTSAATKESIEKSIAPLQQTLAEEGKKPFK